MALEGEPFAAAGCLPHLYRPILTSRRQQFPVRGPGHRSYPSAVPNESSELEVAQALTVIPLEAAVGMRFGLRQQGAQTTYLAGFPCVLHRTDACGIPLPADLLLCRLGRCPLSVCLFALPVCFHPYGGLTDIAHRG